MLGVLILFHFFFSCFPCPTPKASAQPTLLELRGWSTAVPPVAASDDAGCGAYGFRDEVRRR